MHFNGNAFRFGTFRVEMGDEGWDLMYAKTAPPTSAGGDASASWTRSTGTTGTRTKGTPLGGGDGTGTGGTWAKR